MKICYTLSVPNFYMDYMHNLEEKYNIKMTDRELGILAMQPVIYENSTIQKWMETKSTVYFPLNYEL